MKPAADALQLFNGKTDWFSLVEKSSPPVFRPSLNRRKRPPWEIRRSLPNTQRSLSSSGNLNSDGIWSKSMDSFFETLVGCRGEDDQDPGYESEEIRITIKRPAFRFPQN